MIKAVLKRLPIILPFSLLLFFGFILITYSGKTNAGNNLYNRRPADTIRDTVFVTRIIHDTVTVQVVNYVDTNVIVMHKKSFLYIKDTFNIDDRTYYITEDDDTVKVFYHDYTYYIFNYFFKDTLVTVDSVIGCDLYTHCICDERERIVMFHTCEGESRMIVSMLNKQGK
jgi:hypothetical protein